MTNHTPITPAAVRHLEFRDELGAVRSLTVELHAPTCDTAGTPWQCRYRITGLQQRPIDGVSVGEDGLQALYLGIQSIASWMEAAATKGTISYPDGGTFDNLELCGEVTTSKRVKKSKLVRHTNPSLEREIRRARMSVNNDPPAAQEVLRKLRRRASTQNLIESVLLCLQGELSAARAMQDRAQELRLLRALAQHQPSAANLAALGGALQQQEQVRAARRWFLRAAAVVEPGTMLERLILGKLDELAL